METVERVIDMEKGFFTNFTNEYYKHRNIIDEKKIDVMLCDHLNMACVEAAKSAKIPSIITLTMALGPDASAPYINSDAANLHRPTSKGVPFHERLADRIALGRLPRELPKSKCQLASSP
ncbi:hypothetical protein RMATCC62417_00531 [Rhizopus microsporus]|nr:hypothetical protein RMATCC62417_00531 [Rhizopus microsporus]